MPCDGRPGWHWCSPAAPGSGGEHAGCRESKPLGAFYALPLFGGFALYLAGHLLFKRRMHNALSLPVHRPTASPNAAAYRTNQCLIAPLP